MEPFVTAVIGATPNPSRYAYFATERLRRHGFPVMALGFRDGKIADVDIVKNWPSQISDLGIITLYLSPARQKPFYDYMVQLKPQKVIFNPGTENPELYEKLEEAGIKCEEACTLVLLSSGTYGQEII